MSIDLQDRNRRDEFLRTGQLQQALHRDLWRAYRQQPLLRSCVDYAANVFARLGWAPHYDDGDGEPVENTDNALVNAVVADFNEGMGTVGTFSGHGAMAAIIGKHHLLIGEDFIHTSLVNDPSRGGVVNQYAVYSTGELRRTGAGLVEIVRSPGEPAVPLQIGPGVGQLIRIWNPDPEFQMLASSPIEPLLPYFAYLQNARDSLSAVDLSRLGAGVTFFPSEIDWDKQYPPGPDGTGGGFDGFIREFTKVQIEPVRNRKSGTLVAPVNIEIKGELIEKIRHENFSRESIEKDIERVKELTEAIIRGLPLPPASLLGTQEMNHWGAWLLTEEEWKHLAPYASLIFDSITSSLFRPMLQRAGLPDWRQWSIRPDPSKVLLKPDRSKQAIEVFRLGALSFAALLRETGFNSEDLPTPEERIAILEFLKGAPAAPGSPGVAPAPVDQTTTERGAPPPPPGITAAADPVDAGDLKRLGDRLARLDRDLRVKLETAAESAMAQATAKVVGRIWSALPDSERRRLSDYRGAALAAAVGQDRARSLGIDPDALISSAIEPFIERAGTWMQSTMARAQAMAAGALGIKPPDAFEAINKAQADLAAGMLAEANAQLWTVVEPVAEGWAMTASIGRRVRRAVAVAGGENPEDLDDEEAALSPASPRRGIFAGLATGALIMSAITEALRGEATESPKFHMVPVYTWNHHEATRPFPGHERLDGVEFSSFTDPILAVQPDDAWLGIDFYSPGDHAGCECDYDLRFELEPLT